MLPMGIVGSKFVVMLLLRALKIIGNISLNAL